jgi:hypothetical protein
MKPFHGGGKHSPFNREQLLWLYNRYNSRDNGRKLTEILQEFEQVYGWMPKTSQFYHAYRRLKEDPNYGSEPTGGGQQATVSRASNISGNPILVHNQVIHGGIGGAAAAAHHQSFPAGSSQEYDSGWTPDFGDKISMMNKEDRKLGGPQTDPSAGGMGEPFVPHDDILDEQDQKWYNILNEWVTRGHEKETAEAAVVRDDQKNL